MQEVISRTYAEFEKEFDATMQETAEKFVVIGYLLKEARDTGVLKESGYTSMGEFAQKRYGLTKDITSRYIAINDRYSENGNSKYLAQRYKNFGYAKLAEMLTLPDTIVEEISPEMTKKDVIAVKEEVREELTKSDIEVLLEERDHGVEMVESMLGKVIYQICHEHSGIFRRLWVAVNEKSADMEYLLDALAPSGLAMLSCRIPGTGRLMLSVKGIDESLQVINVRSNEKEEFPWKKLQQVAVQFCQTETEDWKTAWQSIYNEDLPEEKAEVAPVQPESRHVIKAAKPKPKKPERAKEKKDPEPVAVQEEEDGISGRNRSVTAGSDRNDGEVDNQRSGGSETTPDCREAPQSDEKSSSQKGEEYQALKGEAEELAHSVYDVFRGWNKENTIPLGELERAFGNAQKLVQMIEQLINMTDKEKTE